MAEFAALWSFRPSGARRTLASLLNTAPRRRRRVMLPTDTARLPSLERLRSLISPPGARPFRVGILIGPGFVPMDMVGVQGVLGLMPGAQIHLLWKSQDLVEGLPSWWTRPTTTYDACPAELDVIAVPMLPPEVLSDPEVIDFVSQYGRRARYLIGICNGVLL